MPATTTKKTRNTIRSQAAILRREIAATAAADWRRWAIDLAEGGAGPAAAELMTAGAALAIDDPAAAIEADAQAIVDARQYTINVAKSEAAVAEKIAAFGSVDGISEALTKAKAEVARLEALLSEVADGCSAWYWRSLLHQLRSRHARIWPDALENAAAEGL
jgi:hypothetical protein